MPLSAIYGFNTDGQLENLGQSTYNALEAQLTRRFHNGLNLMASYTWSKTLTNAEFCATVFRHFARRAALRKMSLTREGQGDQ